MFSVKMFNWAVKEGLYDKSDFDKLEDLDKSLIETAYYSHRKEWDKVFTSPKTIKLFESRNNIMDESIE